MRQYPPPFWPVLTGESCELCGKARNQRNACGNERTLSIFLHAQERGLISPVLRRHKISFKIIVSTKPCTKRSSNGGDTMIIILLVPGSLELGAHGHIQTFGAGRTTGWSAQHARSTPHRQTGGSQQFTSLTLPRAARAHFAAVLHCNSVLITLSGFSFLCLQGPLTPPDARTEASSSGYSSKLARA